MRFLADECCPAPIVLALREAGHDVLYALEEFPGAHDEFVLARAIQEGRIIITEDYDFGEMAVRGRHPIPGLLILALANQASANRVERALSVVDTFGDALLGRITLVERGRERARPLNFD